MIGNCPHRSIPPSATLTSAARFGPCVDFHSDSDHCCCRLLWFRGGMGRYWLVKKSRRAPTNSSWARTNTARSVQPGLLKSWGVRTESPPTTTTLTRCVAGCVSLQVLCRTDNTAEDMRAFSELISRDYRAEWIIDNLPVGMRMCVDCCLVCLVTLVSGA